MARPVTRTAVAEKDQANRFSRHQKNERKIKRFNLTTLDVSGNFNTVWGVRISWSLGSWFFSTTLTGNKPKAPKDNFQQEGKTKISQNIIFSKKVFYCIITFLSKIVWCLNWRLIKLSYITYTICNYFLIL